MFGSCGVVWFQMPTWAGGDGIGGSAEEVAREKGVVVARRRKTRKKGEACLMALRQHWLSARRCTRVVDGEGPARTHTSIVAVSTSLFRLISGRIFLGKIQLKVTTARTRVPYQYLIY